MDVSALQLPLLEENRVLRRQLLGRRLMLSEDDRRRLGRRGAVAQECLDRVLPLGERHFRRAVTEFVEPYHRERIIKG